MGESLLSVAVRILPGLLIATAALQAQPFHRQDGSLLPAGWAVAISGLALSLVAVAWRTRWQRFIAMLALAIFGQACALQLINAPPFGIYQRFFPLRDLLAPSRLPFLFGLVLQTVIVIWSTRELWPSLRRWLPGLLTIRQLITLGWLTLASAVLLSRDLNHYALEIIFTLWIYAVSALNLAAVVAAVPNTIFQRWQEIPDGLDRRLPLLAAAWTTAICALIAWFAFEGVPHISDSVSYFIQAKYFSTGHLYLPAPPDDASFNVSHLFNDGTKWFAYGFPGWPAVLTIGVLAGVPWLMNPMLAGIVIILAHSLVSRLHDRRTAHAVVLLLTVSPWFLFTSSSLMGHTVSLVWTLAAALAVEKERRSGRGLWGAAAGVFLGALFLTRPIEGVLVGGAIGLWALRSTGKRIKLRAVAGLVAASILVGGLDFVYNHALTGDAFYPPHMKWADEKAYGPGIDRLGFGLDVGNVGWPHLDAFPGHGLRDVIANTHMNAYAANFELFGWGFGSFIFVFLVLILGELRREDWLFTAIAISIIGGQTVYWFSGGPDFGARYWFQALIPFVFFTVRGVSLLQTRLRNLGAPDGVLWRVAMFPVVASLVALLNVVPWRSVGKYHRYRGISADVGRIAKAYRFGNDSLVFVSSRTPDDYDSAALFNPPTLQSPGTIYALDAGPVHRKIVLRYFPGRRVWFLSGAPEQDGRLRVVAGPLLPKDVEAMP